MFEKILGIFKKESYVEEFKKEFKKDMINIIQETNNKYKKYRTDKNTYYNITIINSKMYMEDYDIDANKSVDFIYNVFINSYLNGNKNAYNKYGEEWYKEIDIERNIYFWMKLEEKLYLDNLLNREFIVPAFRINLHKATFLIKRATIFDDIEMKWIKRGNTYTLDLYIDKEKVNIPTMKKEMIITVNKGNFKFIFPVYYDTNALRDEIKYRVFNVYKTILRIKEYLIYNYKLLSRLETKLLKDFTVKNIDYFRINVLNNAEDKDIKKAIEFINTMMKSDKLKEDTTDRAIFIYNNKLKIMEYN